MAGTCLSHSSLVRAHDGGGRDVAVKCRVASRMAYLRAEKGHEVTTREIEINYELKIIIIMHQYWLIRVENVPQ